MRIRLYFIGLLILVALAGCGRSLFNYVQREAWRSEAEIACMQSSGVIENAGLVRIAPIQGPGVCGADYPLQVAALGASAALSFAEGPRPPGLVGGGRDAPTWPVARLPEPQPRQPSPLPPGAGVPLSLHPPGIPTAEQHAAIVTRDLDPPAPAITPARRSYDPTPPLRLHEQSPHRQATVSASFHSSSAPRGSVPLQRFTSAIGAVNVNPPATLVCPMVASLHQWMGMGVQPAAVRWFGQPVVGMRQIASYSCRGMNANPYARISEHAFGNALDIAAFTFADGRTVTVKEGWRGRPEEQGFLRDVHSAACASFTTVLAPGSDRFHSDHMHVDLMRRSGQGVCRPKAIRGEVAAARAAGHRNQAMAIRP